MEAAYLHALDAIDPVSASRRGNDAHAHSCGTPYGPDADRARREARRQCRRSIRAASRPVKANFLALLDDHAAMEHASKAVLVHPTMNFCVELCEVLASTTRQQTRAQYEDLLARIRDAPAAFASLRSAIDAACDDECVRPRKDVVLATADALERLVSDPPYRKRFASKECADVRALLAACVESELRSLAMHLRTLVAAERVCVRAGLSSPRIYQDLIDHHTTVPGLRAEAIHAFGLREVARLRRRLSRLPPCDPTPLPRSRVLAAYRTAIARATTAWERRYGTLPVAPCTVRAVPAFLESSTPLAYYEDSGCVYINLSLPHLRRGVEALARHEGVPGHHLQLQYRRDKHPAYRAECVCTAFEEGWAVMAEGLFPPSDTESECGILESELFRACRLVVDTGLHARGWTRERAERYMKANAVGLSPMDVSKEVLRYMANPAQALAYTVGLHALRGLVEKGMSLQTLLTRGSQPLHLYGVNAL